MPQRLHMREGWFALLLIFLLLFIVTLTLEAANWAPGLHILFGVLLVAFGVGVLFAKSRLSGLLMHPLALVLGTGWIGYMALDLAAEGTWEEQLAEIIVRVIVWSRSLSGGEVIPDTLPFVLLMAGLVWLLAYVGTWSFYREHNIWGVLLPGGVTMLVNTYYGGGDLTMLLLLWLVLAFVLVIRTNLLEQEARWRQDDVTYSPDIHFDFIREGTIVAVAIVAFAWLLPNAVSNSDVNPVLARLGQPWGRAQQEWNRLFSSLNYRGTTASGAWFGTSMNFRGPLVRSNRLVMTVRATQGRYWRAVVLDEYTSAGWAVSDKEVSDLSLQEVAQAGALPLGRAEVAQSYTIFAPAGTLLFAAGQPLEVNLPSQVLLSGAPSTPTPDAISQVYAEQALYQGQTYTAVSAIPIVDQQSLRQAGTDYPAEIVAHYTALPDTVSDRVRALAQEVTASAETPFDAAAAIEQYLRGFPYNETISGPNPGEDGVEYFLFREQQGYCDYYASSMAVMLRSLGIPARLAQGYSQGALLPSGEYEVRQTNAHTWVEAFFPGYGWIEFEPTASEPALQRPLVSLSEDDSATSSLPGDSNEADLLAEQEALRRQREEGANLTPPAPVGIRLPGITINPRLLVVPLATLALAGVVGLVGWSLARRRWQHLDRIERLYDQVSLMGRAVGQRLDPTLTPREYAARLGEQVPPVRGPLSRLADLFSKQRFSTAPLADEEVQEAQRSWLEVRRSLVRSALRRAVPRQRDLSRVGPFGARRKRRKKPARK